MNDWAARAVRLAEELVAAGKLHSPEWIAAVREVPRHELMPVFYEQDPGTGAWLTRDATDPVWREQIYANRGLFTKIGEAVGSWGRAVVGLSSTSTPGLMTRMLEALDVHDGHDVLEIGTGTGYNAALLAHRPGRAGPRPARSHRVSAHARGRRWHERAARARPLRPDHRHLRGARHPPGVA